MAFSRRQFMMRTGILGLAAAAPLQALYSRAAAGQTVPGVGYGPLIPDPAGLLDLPRGFKYVAFSQTGEMMSDGTPVPGGHDGMAAFAGPNGAIILIRNHELSPDSDTATIAPATKLYDSLSKGGTTTLVVGPGPERKLLKHYVSLAGTYRNCAGGPTPWGSWISCEENTSTPANSTTVRVPHGYNFEVPILARGPVNPVPLKAMGRFNHEAVAVDPKTGIVYETEDNGEGLFYRFLPNRPGRLTEGGVLQALRIVGMPKAITKSGFPINTPMAADWVTIEDFDPVEDTVAIEGFAKGAAQFSRGEGIWYGNGEFYFTCTNGGAAEYGQVWRYVPGASASEGGTIELFVEPNDPEVLDSPDNIVVTPFSDLFLMEDGDDVQFVRGVTPEGELYSFARNALNDNELAGGCFSPDGRTFFVNIQTPGITFAIWGPWSR
ncbi:MAG: PhoX family protein [Aphanocapsa lilacina HA4352-LM1]|nr:PhoX family protein [Aphanocapsa lilacina HA4352-LM1]